MPDHYQYDVFISYSSQDRGFAERLIKLLRQAKLNVWVDKGRLLGGDTIKPELLQGLRTSSHLIVLLSDAWLASDWTRLEGSTFRKLQKRDTTRRMIPISRVSREDERLPQYLNPDDINFLSWPEEDKVTHAWFFHLYCSIQDIELPEFEQQWEEKGQALLAEGGPVLKPRTAEEVGAWIALFARQASSDEVLQVLSCDRNAQWGRLEKSMADRNHEAFFIPGDKDQDHEIFLQRVQECLPSSGEKPREVLVVKWDEIPTNDQLFRKALASAMGSTEAAQLPRILAECMFRFSVVLLHRPVCKKEFDLHRGALVSYYTNCLPALLQEVDQEIKKLRGDEARRWSLKVVQAVAWPTLSPIGRAVVDLLDRLRYIPPAGLSDEALECLHARAMLREIEARQTDLHPVRLDELCLRIIKDQDLEDLAAKFPKKIHDRRGFPRRIRRGVKNSNMLFGKILEELGLERKIVG